MEVELQFVIDGSPEEETDECLIAVGLIVLGIGADEVGAIGVGVFP